MSLLNTSEEREFTLENGTQFKIENIMPLISSDIINDYRQDFVPDKGEGDVIGLESYLSVLRKENSKAVRELRDIFFERVFFKGKNDKSFMKLKGFEDIAFAELGGVEIFETLWRCVVVNFPRLLPFLRAGAKANLEANSEPISE